MIEKIEVQGTWTKQHYPLVRIKLITLNHSKDLCMVWHRWRDAGPCSTLGSLVPLV